MAEPGRVVQSPKPDMRIEEQFQSRSASMSFSSMTGDTMSPTISMVSFMDPIQLFCTASGDGGTISATGLPKRVTRMGFFVWRTCSSRATHLALNSEMAISFIVSFEPRKYAMVQKVVINFWLEGARRKGHFCKINPLSYLFATKLLS